MKSRWWRSTCPVTTTYNTRLLGLEPTACRALMPPPPHTRVPGWPPPLTGSQNVDAGGQPVGAKDIPGTEEARGGSPRGWYPPTE